jgi:hypothetical protein
MRAHPRYRIEDGAHCVDIRIGSVEQLFDNRDPAPFRERDLDPDLVEYLVDAAEDLAALGPFRLVLWFSATRPGADVDPAIRAHFEYELQRLERHRRRQRRTGTLALVLGVVLLVVLLSIAQLLKAVPSGGVRDAIREGLVIFSWVVLWRPVDTLIYEWLPLHRQRKLMTRLHDAPIEIRVGKGPVAELGPLVRPAPVERAPGDGAALR